MASLIEVRDCIALNGRADARLISHQLNMPEPLVQAMLERLTLMGKLQEVDVEDCLTGSCKSCPEATACQTKLYQIA
ncbi:ferrous iron transporter C [Proteus cibarius]|uniref:Probable [Fe-S]-dependent transcriptional repressor n=1 Tax=Proteus terrae subsp. cibarius TaxID=626774 RepID=A0ABX6JRI9_9GAMM|nr:MULTISPECIES: FeoC-like transcriptional regulator [Proteus]ATM99123.1 ferrous iron transporter C [Proteus vulgaris]MBG3091054.1 ferrous iron transporter C [Proteus terrae subsp. cibarius]MBG6038845.1 ferrous iron transporter C [Proteus terrae subsp. cibarius]MCM2368350.1 FeoC-like transcriptional regulator [Proteus sp. FZP2095]MCO4179602.1 FeoC-like transcriptional regulator [Proteus terrae]